MSYALDALNISKTLQSAKNIALSYNQIGIINYAKGKKLEALDFFQQAMKVGEPVHNNKLNGRIFNNIANLCSELKQYDKALDHYNSNAFLPFNHNRRQEPSTAGRLIQRQVS
jgi:tetratricopeptide (TPR) repeat protein